MSEIVVAEPIYFVDTDGAGPSSRSVAVSHGLRHDYVPEPFESERLPPSLASDIQRFLRVANLIEIEKPRIAYLCKLFGFFFSPTIGLDWI